MASRRRESLKPHLARIRIWVDEGRTDFWIAHELGSTATTIATFRRANGVLRVPGEAPEHVPAPPPEAAAAASEPRAPRARRTRRPAAEAAEPAAAEPVAASAPADAAPAEEGERRRSRRGGRGRRGAAQVEAIEVEGVLEDGTEGYGLWLDAAVAASDVYRRNWAGQRALTVRVEADQIVIRRAPDAAPDA